MSSASIRIGRSAIMLDNERIIARAAEFPRRPRAALIVQPIAPARRALGGRRAPEAKTRLTQWQNPTNPAAFELGMGRGPCPAPLAPVRRGAGTSPTHQAGRPLSAPTSPGAAVREAVATQRVADFAERLGRALS